MGTLRFILAISVVISHSGAIFGFGFVGGQLAVQAFYIISGFYMTMILKEKYIGTNGSYKLFITNRFLRLYPIYWVVLAMAVVMAASGYYLADKSYIWQRYVEYFDTMEIGTFLYLVFTNLVIFFQDAALFLGLDTTTGSLFFAKDFMQTDPQVYTFLFIPQAWTIGLELMFYLIAPFIVRRKMRYILILIACSLALRFVLMFGYELNYDPWTHRFFPTELVFFLLGAIAFHAYKKISTMDIKAFYLKAIWLVMLLFTLIFSFLPFEYYDKYFVYLSLFFVSVPFVFALSKRWKFDREIGELSYPIYISHMFLLVIIKALNLPQIEGMGGLYLVVATVVFSILLNELVAKKVEKIRQSRVRKAA
ncbi:acyltransferase [Dysgonomonas sp. 511]|uniref:acyltransferase family protein n=1 Tax=Dysgonomonas sp. 511 TaxID=2302930 RepID=UPI0013D143D0